PVIEIDHSFVAGDATETFPMRIFNANMAELPAQINVLASAILAVTLAILIAGAWRTIRRAAKR
nr:hypothetical protein [Acidimicrobiia bacterium]